MAAKEAATDDFRAYARQVVANAKALAAALTARGYALVSGGTDNHLMLIDLNNKNVRNCNNYYNSHNCAFRTFHNGSFHKRPGSYQNW